MVGRPDMKNEAARALRGSILRACLQMYPRPTMFSTLRWITDTFGADDEDIEKEIAYLEGRQWLKTRPIEIIGRKDTRVELTSDGVDVARGIDPKAPII